MIIVRAFHYIEYKTISKYYGLFEYIFLDCFIKACYSQEPNILYLSLASIKYSIHFLAKLNFEA
jgi:hypothetical protein